MPVLCACCCPLSATVNGCGPRGASRGGEKQRTWRVAAMKEAGTVPAAPKLQSYLEPPERCATLTTTRVWPSLGPELGLSDDWSSCAAPYDTRKRKQPVALTLGEAQLTSEEDTGLAATSEAPRRQR
eukprot:scaffold26940_cov117-Phaeocystis_antarctica.AAC.19